MIDTVLRAATSSKVDPPSPCRLTASPPTPPRRHHLLPMALLLTLALLGATSAQETTVSVTAGAATSAQGTTVSVTTGAATKKPTSPSKPVTITRSPPPPSNRTAPSRPPPPAPKSPPTPATASVPCPASPPFIRSVSLDVSQYPAFFPAAPAPAPVLAWAVSSRACMQLASRFGCDNSLPRAFFAFSAAKTGFFGSKNLKNCIVGPDCALLAKGRTAVLIGSLRQLSCPKSTPPPSPPAKKVPPPPPAPPPPPPKLSPPPVPVPCPDTRKAAYTVKVNTDAIYDHFGSSVEIVQATDPRDCINQARSAQCGGSGATYFLLSKAGFVDGFLGNMGNCVFGDSCVPLASGSATANFGKLQNSCPAPPAS